jgi:hypothetical protein
MANRFQLLLRHRHRQNQFQLKLVVMHDILFLQHFPVQMGMQFLQG